MDDERFNVRVGFGCTVYARGLANKHLDGIGYYSNELALRLAQTDDVVPIVFGEAGVHDLYGSSVIRLPKFSYSAVASALTNFDFIGSKKIQKRIDVFHAPDHHVPRICNVPILATLMDAIPLSNPEFASANLRMLKNFLWKKTVRWADQIVTISEFSKNEIATHFRINTNRISVVPLGVDERYFHRISNNLTDASLAKLNLPNKFFLFIGTLQPRKNLLRVIKAHQMLSNSIRQEFPLVIIGRVGWGCDDLIDLLKSLPSSEPIKWISGVDDFVKRVLLQRAAALVFPSLSEGFGLPVLEAFAALTPVITSNTSSLPEVAGDAAILVNPLEIGDIAFAMNQVATDEAMVQNLIAKGLTRAGTFSWSACAEKTRAIYSEMI